MLCVPGYPISVALSLDDNEIPLPRFDFRVGPRVARLVIDHPRGDEAHLDDHVFAGVFKHFDSMSGRLLYIK